MSETSVSLFQCDSYEPTAVRRALAALLLPLGGIGAFVSKGDRVLLKPNFLSAREVDRHVCTHPELVLAVAEAALEAGAAEVAVGDSPGFGSSIGVARKLGLVAPLAERGGRIAPFNDPVVIVRPDSVRYRRFEVERAVLEADKIINLPKIKTHAQMFMTLAVKNTFGYVVGTRKAAWHLEAGKDEDLFATMLLDLHCLRKPTLNIADGIIMMEGNGPGAGTPRKLGLLFAGEDGTAVDAIICKTVGIATNVVPTLRVATLTGVGVPHATRIELFGPPLDQVSVRGIEHPILSHPGHFLTPRPLLRLTRRLIEVRPEIDTRRCTGCTICKEQCPAKAISMNQRRDGRTHARIHHHLCIHCYCCQEICPEGAIAPRRGLVRSFLRPPAAPGA
jgi:uncharacterized protein (DUF362 family)/ferredoxin